MVWTLYQKFDVFATVVCSVLVGLLAGFFTKTKNLGVLYVQLQMIIRLPFR
ncbi:MAG: hypothetical protein Ct9H300mP21_04530 [Pseudomonadota bacterium]|nr:MAG: hypothetical protein Ct9H300mP21_04530 [Pseudomonadota bacterium]